MGTDYLLVASNKIKVIQRQLVICLKEYTMWCYVQGDFDIEYDNDAELLLAEMEFNDDDKEYEIDMKMKVLDIYNIRLDERNKRKLFVIERDLVYDDIYQS